MAMGDDDMIDGSVFPLLLDFLASNQSGDVLSPEDIAWADSCLVKDPESSDSSWNSFKDALLDILSPQPVPLDYSAAGVNSFVRNDMETLPSSVDVEADNDIIPSHEDAERRDEEKDVPENQKTDAFYRNAFLPNYNDELKESRNIDIGLDPVHEAHAMEPSTDDIFKVWDLNIPDEEDEFIKMLKRETAESPLESVDDLIAGIADLALTNKSG